MLQLPLVLVTLVVLSVGCHRSREIKVSAQNRPNPQSQQAGPLEIPSAHSNPPPSPNSGGEVVVIVPPPAPEFIPLPPPREVPPPPRILPNQFFSDIYVPILAGNRVVGGGSCRPQDPTFGGVSDCSYTNPTCWGNILSCATRGTSQAASLVADVFWVGYGHRQINPPCPRGRQYGGQADCHGGRCYGNVTYCVEEFSAESYVGQPHVMDLYLTREGQRLPHASCNAGYVLRGVAADCFNGICDGNIGLCVKYFPAAPAGLALDRPPPLPEVCPSEGFGLYGGRCVSRAVCENLPVLAGVRHVFVGPSDRGACTLERNCGTSGHCEALNAACVALGGRFIEQIMNPGTLICAGLPDRFFQ